MFEVRKAKRSRRPLKISLEGLSGSGKTFTALRLAFAMRRAGIGKRIVVADSENESAGLYDGIEIDGEKWEYDVCPLPHDKQNPAGYTEAYGYLTGQGYDLIIMDSLSHAWHGAMEQVDAHAKRNRGDKFGAWAEVTPAQRTMLATLTDGRAHLIATMRVKSEYERYEKQNGKEGIRKIGTKTDQREGAEYEFDVVLRIDAGHEALVEKVRGCTSMDGKSAVKPGPEFWKPLFDWWLSAEPVKSEESISGKIATAATLADLANIWNALTTQQKAQHLAAKDARKSFLLANSPPAAPATETEANQSAVPPVGDSERPGLLARLQEAATCFAMTGDELLAKFRGPAGIKTPTAKVGDLRTDQLQELVLAAETELELLANAGEGA